MPEDDLGLHEMPEWKRLSDYERHIILCRLAKVQATYRHPERGVRLGELIDKIKRELKTHQRVQ